MAETRRPQSAVGISNRETPREEAEERREHPPEGADAGAATADRQPSSKTGARSTAQKESESKYADRPMPATSKTGGAFGRERDR
jgi:hypothetical protein